MFTDPQSITVAGSAKSLPKILDNGLKSTYQMSDLTFKLRIEHTETGQRVQSMVRLDQRAIVADPLTSANTYANLGVWIVFNRPLSGFTTTQINDLVQALCSYMTSTVVGKLVGEES
ncbi:coat protein [ssRNA phage Gerhypos.1_8]|jgi:hypothetical protein|uniref:Coat protein n=2 Tax=Leviviricetes TaxID=2842243 RepID=A0A8S5KXQ6_9VIRU|nr:coat protein [ssRNA phage Gerhypos.1_8]QDH90465.1 MAG: hypothetical protein H1Bulk29154_000002 [Leviviridae sp.]DAD50040.1 TPA_asm: coat protein [ssRNA phage Gerhypos.1_8]